MARYINLDDAIKYLHNDCKAKYPLSYVNGLEASINELNKLPIADVVPKSEVAVEIFEEIERLLAVYSYTDEYGKEVIGVDVEELIAELKKKYTEDPDT